MKKRILKENTNNSSVKENKYIRVTYSLAKTVTSDLNWRQMEECPPLWTFFAFCEENVPAINTVADAVCSFRVEIF